MKKISDDIDALGIASSAINADPGVSVANVGSAFAATAGLVGRGSPKLAIATLNPIIDHAVLKATRFSANAAIREALKPIAAIQSVMDTIRPITQLNEQLASYRSVVAELGIFAHGAGRYAQISKQLASVQPLFSTLKLAEVRPLSEMFGMVGTLRGASLVAAELAAITAATQFKVYPKSVTIASIGAALLKAGQLPDAVEIEWEEPASDELISTLTAAADALNDTVEEAPENVKHLAELPGASNDSDGAFSTTPQQLQIELAAAASTGDLSKLSPATKIYLKWFCWLILVLLNYVALQNAVREELCFVQPKIFPGMTAGQIGKAVRKSLCEASVEVAGEFRVVKGVGVRLRESPSRKATILPINLADGQIIEILDSSDKDWLYVSTPSQGGVDGWIFRKYTRVLSTD